VTPTTTTERLTLRSLIDVDLPELVALNGDPEAMPFITGRALTPAELEAEHEAAAEIGWRLPRSRWAGASPPRAPGREVVYEVTRPTGLTSSRRGPWPPSG
jgi:RimJ/RimL family protein N-acetyltransferase